MNLYDQAIDWLYTSKENFEFGLPLSDGPMRSHIKNALDFIVFDDKTPTRFNMSQEDRFLLLFFALSAFYQRVYSAACCNVKEEAYRALVTLIKFPHLKERIVPEEGCQGLFRVVREKYGLKKWTPASLI